MPPAIPRSAQLVVCLPDELAIALFIQLGRVIRSSDRSMPDVEHDTQVAFVPYADDSTLPGLPRLYVFERRGLDADPALQALARRLDEGTSPAPVSITTTKASLFNYLHPGLIHERLGIHVEVTDRSDVPLLTARALLPRENRPGWEELSSVEQAQLLGDAKRLLITRVATAMTPNLLTERMGTADVTRWLYAIKLNLPRQFFD